jgi:hypothetical protein
VQGHCHGTRSLPRLWQPRQPKAAPLSPRTGLPTHPLIALGSRSQPFTARLADANLAVRPGSHKLKRAQLLKRPKVGIKCDSTIRTPPATENSSRSKQTALHCLLRNTGSIPRQSKRYRGYHGTRTSLIQHCTVVPCTRHGGIKWDHATPCWKERREDAIIIPYRIFITSDSRQDSRLVRGFFR